MATIARRHRVEAVAGAEPNAYMTNSSRAKLKGRKPSA